MATLDDVRAALARKKAQRAQPKKTEEELADVTASAEDDFADNRGFMKNLADNVTGIPGALDDLAFKGISTAVEQAQRPWGDVGANVNALFDEAIPAAGNVAKGVVGGIADTLSSPVQSLTRRPLETLGMVAGGGILGKAAFSRVPKLSRKAAATAPASGLKARLGKLANKETALDIVQAGPGGDMIKAGRKAWKNSAPDAPVLQARGEIPSDLEWSPASSSSSATAPPVLTPRAAPTRAVNIDDADIVESARPAPSPMESPDARAMRLEQIADQLHAERTPTNIMQGTRESRANIAPRPPSGPPTVRERTPSAGPANAVPPVDVPPVDVFARAIPQPINPPWTNASTPAGPRGRERAASPFRTGEQPKGSGARSAAQEFATAKWRNAGSPESAPGPRGRQRAAAPFLEPLPRGRTQQGNLSFTDAEKADLRMMPLDVFDEVVDGRITIDEARAMVGKQAAPKLQALDR